jgi:hypothetical protein
VGQLNKTWQDLLDVHFQRGPDALLCLTRIAITRVISTLCPLVNMIPLPYCSLVIHSVVMAPCFHSPSYSGWNLGADQILAWYYGVWWELMVGLPVFKAKWLVWSI